MPHKYQLILSVPTSHWQPPHLRGHFLIKDLLRTFDVPQANRIFPPSPPQLPWALPYPQTHRLGPSREAGLHELHLTLPAQHCLLWPLWECCAICWPQTFYEQEDRKKFFSIDRSQDCSLPFFFVSLLGEKENKIGDKVKTTLSELPSLRSSSPPSPVPDLK